MQPPPICGKGSYTYPDGGVYEGDFDASLRHGSGMMIFPDGTQYRQYPSLLWLLLLLLSCLFARLFLCPVCVFLRVFVCTCMRMCVFVCVSA